MSDSCDVNHRGSCEFTNEDFLHTVEDVIHTTSRFVSSRGR
jgi:hypothetical protein